MAALCTGPVAMPSSRPSLHASAAARRAPITLVALAGSGVPKAGRAGCGISTRRACPGPVPSSGSGSSKVRAARSRAARSPNTVMSAPWSRCSAATHSSGPTPAGSPGTSARRGRVISAAVCAGTDPDVDVGLAAHLAQEALPFVFHLALADAFADGGAALFVVHFRLARGDPLDHVPAGLGAERLRYSAVLQRCQLGTELGAEIVGPEPAQVAAAGGAGGVLGGFGRNRGEVFARDDPRAQRLGAGSGLVVPRRVLAGADEDVARVVLGLGTAAGGA